MSLFALLMLGNLSLSSADNFSHPVSVLENGRSMPPTSYTAPAAATKRILKPLHPMANYSSLVVDQVLYTSKRAPEKWLTSKIASPNLGNLLGSETIPKLIVIGGSLSAGVQDGGLHRQGQQLAYPNLVAHQLGISDFASPLFDPAEGNGTGYMLYADPKATYPTWKNVVNNLATIQEADPPIISSYKGPAISNFSVPGLGGDKALSMWYPNGSYNNGSGHLWLDYQIYMWRYMPSEQNQKITLIDYIRKQQPYNLFILEDGLDQWLSIIKRNSNVNGMEFYSDLESGLPREYLPSINKLLQTKSRGVIFTIPDFRDMAYMKWYTTSDFKQKAGKINITYSRMGTVDQQLDPETSFKLMPTESVAAIYKNLKKGDDVSVKLTDADVMDAQELGGCSPETYNTVIKKWATEYNLAVVDLYTLYKQIGQGTFRTDDGFTIDGSPKGNFYSSDGIYPTALGQAIIANEVIKSLNNTYKVSIPLINIQDFLATIDEN